MTGALRLQTRRIVVSALIAIAIGVLPAARGATAAGSSGVPHFYYHVHPLTHQVSKALKVRDLSPSFCVAVVGLACYQPRQIRAAYNVPNSLTGAGQHIMIVDAYGSPTVAQDAQIFSSVFGLAAPTIHVWYPQGRPDWSHADDNMYGWAGETSLDVQWAHAIAPGAVIDLVVARSNQDLDIEQAEAWAIGKHLGNVLSESYGENESAIPSGQYNPTAKLDHNNYGVARAAGISVLVAAGDSGANDGGPSIVGQFPADDPLVTSVGGTNLFASDAGQYRGETVWNDSDPNQCAFGCSYGPIGATGGSESAFFQSPLFQSPFSQYAGRTTSDVSWNASLYTGIFAYLGFYPNSNDNGFYFIGGTSEGAPAWAGVVALMDQAAGHGLGQLNPWLYTHATYGGSSGTFRDVTSGDNGFFGPGYSAGPGYDIPTGLGTPNVTNLIAALQSGL